MADAPSSKLFWESKILRWESSRYSDWVSLYPLSWPVRARLNQAVAAVHARFTYPLRVCELGCGSGRFAERIRGLCSAYEGVDIADVAIEMANKRIADPRFRFRAADVINENFAPCDLTVFLGLTDWIEPDGLDKLFSRLNSPTLLFSYTEASSLNPYRLYRAWMDRPERTRGQWARTFAGGEIRELLERHGYSPELIHSPRPWNPGGLVWATKGVAGASN